MLSTTLQHTSSGEKEETVVWCPQGAEEESGLENRDPKQYYKRGIRFYTVHLKAKHQQHSLWRSGGYGVAAVVVVGRLS